MLHEQLSENPMDDSAAPIKRHLTEIEHEQRQIRQPAHQSTATLQHGFLVERLGHAAMVTNVNAPHVTLVNSTTIHRGGGQMPSLRGPYRADLHLASPPQ